MKKTPRQRLFTNEFKKGDVVAIIREEHGWHDGRTVGRIVGINEMSATVMTDDGSKFEINHPRDIKKYR